MWESFASGAGNHSCKKACCREYQLEMFAAKSGAAYKGFSGDGFVEVAKQINTNIIIPVTVSETGLYAIDFRYANGNGPQTQKQMCHPHDKDRCGLCRFCFPQRGAMSGATGALAIQYKPG